MDTESLDFYKKQRTSLEKSFISDLNKMLEDNMAEWNELSPFKKSIYRQKYDTLINDTAKKLKDEIAKLRALKKTEPANILASDIQRIIVAENEIPDCYNPFDWLKKFRKNFLNMDCFVRVVLFDRLDCKDMWNYDIIDEVRSSDRLHLEEKDPYEQFNTLLHLVTSISSKHTSPHKQILDSMPEEDFLDTITGQISMNI